MKKHVFLVLAVGAVAFLFACNKQKPHKLNYNTKEKAEMYDPEHGGLPGTTKLGPQPNEEKHHGYHKGEGHDTKVKQPEEKKAEEAKPEEKKAEEVKPEEKKAEEAKPEEKKAEEAKPEEKKAEETKPEEKKAE